MTNDLVIGFDWDGTLVQSWAATPLPGVRERLAALPAGTRTFIATNQGGPAWRAVTGEIKYPTTDDVADRIISGLAALGWRPDLLFVATHPGQEPAYAWRIAAREAITPLYERLKHTCWCSVSGLLDSRKPRPGMLIDARLECDCEPTQILYVGDMDSDAQAATAAGARFQWAAEWRAIS